jgi:hypothetical protein
MSQLVLDDQLDLEDVLPGLESWITSVRLQSLRPREQILDNRIPEILLTLKQPTFVTIDHGFWNRLYCHPEYCIIFCDLITTEQHLLPALLRRLFRLPEFRTRAARMGKVARVGKAVVTFWEANKKAELNLPSDV